MTDFDRGAIAMRDRIADGIRRWWQRAQPIAGHRWPGHPHWLEAAIRNLTPEALRENHDPNALFAKDAQPREPSGGTDNP